MPPHVSRIPFWTPTAPALVAFTNFSYSVGGFALSPPMVSGGYVGVSGSLEGTGLAALRPLAKPRNRRQRTALGAARGGNGATRLRDSSRGPHSYQQDGTKR